MMKTRLTWLLIGAVAGMLVTVLGTVFYWSSFERYVRLQTLSLSIADRSATLIPLLINLEEQNLEHLEGTARSLLTTGVVILDSNLEALDEDTREIVTPVLESIAAKRERLKLGKYASPPHAYAEEVLTGYDR